MAELRTGLALMGVLLGGLLLGGAASADQATLARFPTLHGDQIVFEAHGNLWQVGRRGGKAGQLH